jgi:hypothetical protein
MLTQRTYRLWLGISVAIASIVLAGWAGFGSEWMSGPTLRWIGAVVIALIAVSLLAMRAGRATRSVAQVLYEAEHPKEPSL